MKLHLHNRYDNTEYDFSVDSIWVAADPTVFQFNILMPEGAAFGEYNYTLTDEEGHIFETGILKYRPDERVEPVEYHQDITYLAYEAE